MTIILTIFLPFYRSNLCIALFEWRDLLFSWQMYLSGWLSRIKMSKRWFDYIQFLKVSNVDNIFSTQLCANRNVDEAVNALDRKYVFVGEELLDPIVNCVCHASSSGEKRRNRKKPKKQNAVGKPRRFFSRDVKKGNILFLYLLDLLFRKWLVIFVHLNMHRVFFKNVFNLPSRQFLTPYNCMFNWD